jgi:carbon starvation protein
MIARESHAWPIGYGAMLLEGFVAIMALVAAASLQPGVYFAVNAPPGVVGATAQAASATITHWGFPVSAQHMSQLAHTVGETTLFGRTGGAPSLALGMAQIFGGVFRSARFGDSLLSFWYHFAIMFEALFILTIIDAGTRVGRFMLQDLLSHAYQPLGRTSWMPGILITSAAVVAAWGYFLYQGVIDPLGGINSLWPLFGISNQLLAAIALCVGTTVVLKSHRARYAWITVAPLSWLVIVTFTAGIDKIFSAEPRIGFLAHANALERAIAGGTIAGGKLAETRAVIFNERLDAVVCSAFLVLVAIILIDSVRVWFGLLRGTRENISSEAPFVPSQLEAEAVWH